MKVFIVIILVAAAAAGGWFIGTRSKSSPSGESGGREVAYYQSAMHPWIKSDKPGDCTICGMKLTPVYEGEKGFETGANIVTLSSNSINVLNVQSELVERRPIERKLLVAGKIESDETRVRVISAYVDGRIEKLFVNYTGAEVKTGEPLAVLYSPALLTAEREYLTLLGQTNFVSSPALQGQHERLIEGARQRLRRLGLTDEQIRGLRADASTNFTSLITAPIGGTVVNRSAFEGQYVKEGDKLFEISDLSRMWFRFNVYEQDLPFIGLSNVVRVSSPALGAKAFEGPIAFIEPTINQETRSARVRVELQNPSIEEEQRKSRGELLNGLYADGTILIKTEPVLAVSKTAVLNPGDEPRVYIDKGDGAYEHRPVKLGRQGEQFVEIFEGLSDGEKVVTSGNLLLDSQAQLNRTSSGSEAGHQHQSSKPEPKTDHGDHKHVSLSSEQLSAAKEFFTKFVLPLNEHLAADDLVAYNELIAHALRLAAPLSTQFKEDSALAPQIAKVVSETKKMKNARDLAAARSQHKEFSAATVELYRVLAPELALDAKIFKCPMYPKPGQNAFWVQAKPPLRNPFYGAEMLNCGVEVK